MRGKLSFYATVLIHDQRADLLYYFQLRISSSVHKVMEY